MKRERTGHGGLGGNVAATVLWQGVAMSAALAFHVLASRWLGADGRGHFAMAFSGAQIAATLMGLGFPGAASFYAASRPESTWVLFRRAAWLLFVSAAVVLAALLVFRAVGAGPFAAGDEVVLTLLIFGTGGQIAYASLALAMGRVGVFNASAVAMSAVSLLGLGVVRWLGVDDVQTTLSVLVVGAMAGVLVAVCGIAKLLRTIRARQDASAPSLRQQLRVAGYGFASNILGLLMLRADVFLVATLGGGARAAGLYSVGGLFAEVFAKLPNWMGAVLSPHVAREGRGARAATVALFWISLGVALVGYLPLVIFPGVVDWLLLAVVGTDFAAAQIVILGMLPRVVAQAASSILFANLAGMGYTLYHPLACGLGVLAMVIADLFLIPQLGILGAALGSGIGYFVAGAAALAGCARLNGTGLVDFVGKPWAWAGWLTSLRGPKSQPAQTDQSAETMPDGPTPSTQPARPLGQPGPVAAQGLAPGGEGGS